MFPPTTQRPPHHPMMAQQSGYIGYYSASHHPSQYQNSTDLNYNYQPSMGHLSEGYNSGSWANHPMYMASHANHASMYSQRPSGYDEWSLMSSAMHQGSSSETSSPGLLSTMTSNSLLQPPLTPSPCTLSNGNHADMESSPYYRNFCNRTTPNYGDHDSIKTEDDLDIPPPDISIEPKSPNQPDSPYMPNWLKKSNSQSGNTDDTFAELETGSKGAYDEEYDENKNISWKVGKTRTKDKYRVVYNDHQRMELEKEFLYSRYITIRKKTELAQMLGLSERQVKIWFQNRRAKERKQTKKRSDVNGDDKEKIENGLTFLQGSSFHAPLHHPHSGGPPMFHHQFHVHQFPQHHKHPLMMDVKPTFSMELKPMDTKPSLPMQDDDPPIDFEMKVQTLNNNMN